MSEQHSRPGWPQTAGEVLAVDIPIVLTAADSHLFGVGMSQTDRDALNRRGLASLAQAWPAVLEQLARRFLQDAVASALPGYWLGRAERLEAIGTEWADGAAKSARRHAWLLATCGAPGDVLASVDDLLGVV